MILGASGYLGSAVAAECARRNLPFVGTRRSAGTGRGASWLRYRFPADDPARVFRDVSPTHVIMAARLADGAPQAGAESAFAPSLRSLVAALAGGDSDGQRRRILYVSSDAVFSGKREPGPWAEGDAPEPGTAYGRRQWAAEQVFADAAPCGLVCRCSYLCAGQDGPLDKRWRELSDHLTAGREVRGATNLFKSPVPVRTAARLLVQAALSDLTGVLHLPGERMNVHDFFVWGLRRLELADRRSLLRPTTVDSGVDTSLRSERVGGITDLAP